MKIKNILKTIGAITLAFFIAYASSTFAYIYNPTPGGGGGGSQTLQQVTDLGNSTTNSIDVAGISVSNGGFDGVDITNDGSEGSIRVTRDGEGYTQWLGSEAFMSNYNQSSGFTLTFQNSNITADRPYYFPDLTGDDGIGYIAGIGRYNDVASFPTTGSPGGLYFADDTKVFYWYDDDVGVTAYVPFGGATPGIQNVLDVGQVLTHDSGIGINTFAFSIAPAGYSDGLFAIQGDSAFLGDYGADVNGTTLQINDTNQSIISSGLVQSVDIKNNTGTWMVLVSGGGYPDGLLQVNSAGAGTASIGDYGNDSNNTNMLIDDVNRNINFNAQGQTAFNIRSGTMDVYADDYGDGLFHIDDNGNVYNGDWNVDQSGVYLAVEDNAQRIYTSPQKNAGFDIDFANATTQLGDVHGNGNGTFLNIDDNNQIFEFNGGGISANGITAGGISAQQFSIAGTTTGSTNYKAFNLVKSITQGTTDGYTIFNMDVTETSLGSGVHNLMSLNVGGQNRYLLQNDGSIKTSENSAAGLQIDVLDAVSILGDWNGNGNGTRFILDDNNSTATLTGADLFINQLAGGGDEKFVTALNDGRLSIVTNIPISRAQNTGLGLTGSQTLATYTNATGANHNYLIGTNLFISAITAGAITINVSYTDVAGTPTTQALITAASVTGKTNPGTIMITAQASSVITVSAVFTGTSILYNASGLIQSE